MTTNRTRRNAAASVLLATTAGLLAFTAVDSASADPIVEEETTTTVAEETTTTTEAPTTTTTAAPTTTTTVAPVVLTDEPSITSVVARPSALTVTWVAQEDLSDGPIRAYVVTALENDLIKRQQVVAGDIRSASLSGLTNGHTYDVVVLPYQDGGAGLLSNPVEGTPNREASAVAEATAVRDLAVTPARGFAQVSWKAPATDGGSPISSYAVITTESVSGAFHSWRTLGADERSASVPNLVNNRAYKVNVVAITGVGFGDLAPAVAVTPSGVSAVLPQAPQASWVSALLVGDNASISFGPATERGEALTGWSVIVMQDGGMVAWKVLLPGAQRQVLVPLDDEAGDAQVYVVAQSASGFGPLAGPLTIDVPAPAPVTP